ncbi:MAG: putative apolipoprotein N-acyltransferase [Pseudomonadota bacterium]
MPAWLHSLLVLFFLGLLIHLWQREERSAHWLAAGLLWIASLYSVHWIYISLHDYGLMAAPIAALATGLLGTYLAAYGWLAAWMMRRWLLPPPDSGTGLRWLGPWALAATITLLEWLRGTLFTGFPWANWGYQQVDSWLSGFAPVFGVYGVVFVTALCAAWLASLRPKALLGAVIVHLAGGALASLQWAQPYGQPIQVALIQPAVPQQMKFEPQAMLTNERTHLSLAAVAASPSARLDLMVLPETAFIRPWQDLSEQTRQSLQAAADRSGAVLMTGIPSRDGQQWANSLIALRPTGTDTGLAAARYDKHHLVPFGEFIPWGFRWFVDLMQMPLGDFTSGPATQPTIPVADQHIGVNICFEDLFGEEIVRAVRSSTNGATILLNVSNLAWFGNTIALQQHLAIARMRSLEAARPTVRATNTGMTAHIDHKGRVQAASPAMVQDILLVRVQGMEGQTPYVFLQNGPILGLVSLVLLALVWLRRRSAGGLTGPDHPS